jgi:hypothetical protein
MEKKKLGRPIKDPNRPLKRSQRRKTASAVNKDGSLRKVHIKFTPAKQREYLELLAQNGLKTHTCRLLNVSREMVRYERKKNPAFAELEDEALTFFNEGLEEEAIRRAKEGVLKPVFYKGAEVGHIKEFSDRLMEVLLTGRIPEKYGKQLKGDNNVNISGVLVINARPSADDWETHSRNKMLPQPEEIIIHPEPSDGSSDS